MRRLLAGAVLMAVVGTTAGCGGGAEPAATAPPNPAASAPTTATTAAFCAQALALLQARSAAQVRAWALTMERIGTPSGITADQRRGFEKTVAYAATIKSDHPINGGLAAIDPTGGDGRLVLAFATYAAATCPSSSPVPAPAG